MKSNELDKLVKEKLAGLRPPVPPNSWQQFEQRLDEAESGTPKLSGKAVDEALYNKLHQLQAPYQASNWSSFQERLDREFVRPGLVKRYKAMELMLFLLILLTFWQYIPLPTTESAQPIAGNEPTTATTEISSTDDQPSPAALADSRQPNARNAIISSETADENELPPSANNSNAKTFSSEPLQRQKDAALYSLTPLDPRFLQLTPSQKKNEQLSLPIHSSSAEFNAPSTGIALLTELNSGLPGLLAQESGSEAFPLQPNRQRRYLYFSMFGSMDYNRIMTPSERFFDVETNAFDRYALGYSGGFALGFEWGRWELQSGAIYSSKRYRPLQLLIRHGNSRDGYSTEQLKDITLNILHVPLNFRYNFFRYDRWRLYTLTGASLQMATKANYFVDSQGTARRSVLSNYIENGWFEGGTFQENSYLSANLGLGVERFITTRWSIFAQPTYQHVLYHFDGGFGPTSDQINTMSILTGIRVRMQRN